MKKLLLFFLTGFSIITTAQVTVFEDSFETYTDFSITGFGDWLSIDMDLLDTYTGGTVGPAAWPNAGEPQAFMIFNPTLALTTNATTGVGGSTENRNFDPRTGLKFAACWAGVPAPPVTANNDWLVSPVLNLTTVTGAALSVWAKSMSDSYGLEKFRIGVYVGTGVPTLPSDFTIISGATDLTAPYAVWTESTYPLTAYEGQNIRVAIQCKTPDAYMFMVDDFKVTATSLSVKDILASKFSVNPNPATDLISISNAENIAVNELLITDLNGRIVQQHNVTNAANIEVNVADLSAGMYLMTINSDQGTAIKKIMKH